MNRCKDNQSKVNIQRLLLILLVFVAVTTNGQTTWLGTTDSDWNTPGNWSNGVPGINDDVTIGDVTNDPVISVSGAVAKSITIELDGLLTITIDGTLTIDGAATQAILNLGTLENNGTITLGATTGNGLYGIRNEAIFNNYGPINIDRSTISGINNLNGTFYNSATINIGTVEGNGDYGIKNNASFISSSSINIDRSTNSAIYNTAGIFENGSDLNIGAIASVGSYGIKNEADFNNNSQIYINRSSIAAISNLMGTFNNNSTLTLGNLESIGDYGINNEALFNHNSESINVDKSEIDGIYNLSGTFTNTATIIIGANYPVGTHGIRNESAFDNNGSIQIDRSTTSGIFMSNGLFTNNSNVTIGANVSIADLITANMGTFSHVSGTLSGTGSIAANKFSNAGGTLSPGYSPGILTFDADEDFTNSSMLIEITGGGGTGGTDFDLIYVDGIATIGANTNLSLEFSYAASDGTTFDVLTANNISGTIPIGNITFTNVGAGNITGVSVSYPGNNKIRITVSTPATWTGNIDTDWQNGGNWSSGVPDATDVVIIPDEANDPTISSGAVAKTLTIQNGAVLTITSGGTLSINGSMTEQGLLNQGTLDNSGILNIGNTNGNGWYGIRNEGTFSNNPNGIINIDRSTDAGLYNVSGVFTNQGEIIIGGIANSGYYGISNNTEFNNNTGGNININQVTSVGILHQSDIFTNEGLITIGNNPSTSVYDGIQSLSSFNNNTGGEIKIDRTINNGYFNNAGTITNEATIIIGANASVGEYGVQNNGSFANNSGGMINIDRSNINGIYHVSGTFINHAIINIGTISNTGDNGIENSPAFVNDIDGTINIDRATNYGIRSHSNTFTNQGNISIGALVSIPNLITGKFSNATNGTLNGAGTIQASNFSNDGGTLAPGIPLGKMTYTGSESFNNCTLNLEINGAGGVGGVDFDQIVVSGTATMGSTSFLNLIFTYATDNGATFDIISATSTSGTFNTSNVTFSNTGAGNVTAVSLTYISGKVRVTVTTSNIWSGSISSDWNVAGNWSAGVPDATNFIIIPDVTNDPNINNSVAIQGLKIETGGLLNIESTGTLTINGSQTGQGILNQGTIQNNGILNVGSTTSTGPIGIRNEGTINNNSGGTVNVDRATDIQLYNSGGTITNVANINLSALINVGIIGIKNESVFENNAGGTIKIDRFSAGTPNTTAINNISGSFTNVATITIGAISGGGCQYGIINNATFSNNTGGIINMDAVSKAGIKNSSGTFTNQSSITIGSIASSSVLEGILNESAFNNNSGGIIAIDRFSGMNSAGIHNSMGTLTNQGTITIGATAGSGYYGIKNDAQFNNNSGGVVNIDRSTHEIYNSSGTFTNESTIIIGMVDLAGYNGVSNYAEFFNNSGGTINIDRMYDYGIFNFAGTFSNHANINIGNVGYNGEYGIRNYSTFINSSGLIKIDRTAIIAIWNSTGTFTNHAEIKIGESEYSGEIGIKNEATFNNLSNGMISIDRLAVGAVSGAITNAQGTFTNQATINIGSIASVGYYGIQNSAISIFNNNINGIINIDRTVSTGFEAGGSVSNDGTINIGAVASVGPYGFSCGSGFTNHINGILNIDRSTEIGFSTGATINDGLINIGSISSVGIWGLNLSNANPEIFTNNPTGVININRTNEYGIESYDLAQILNKGIITIGELVPLTDLIHQASINNLPGGILKGTGKITGSAFGTGLGDNGGTLSPGYSPGTMTFTQSQTFSSGIIDIEIIAGTPVTFDKIIVNGTATLGGTLNITETGSVATGSYIIFSATSISGTFATVNIPDCYTLEYGATTVSLKKGVSKIWDGTVNNWNQPNHWNPYGVPCPLDDVIINAGECSLNINPDMKSLTINGGTLKKVDAATYSINVKTTVAGAGKINVFAGTLDMNDTLDNNGTIQGFANIDLLGATVIGGYGRWAPGNSTGVLDAKGTYNNEVIEMEIGGNGGGIGTVELDKLNVSQTMVIGGNLDLLWLGGSVPIGNRVLMECAGGSGCRTGTFASIAFPAQCNGNCNIIYTPTEVRLENTQPIEFIGTCTWLGGTGNWSTVAKWSCNDVPNFNDDVVINSGTVTVDNPTTCKTMVLGGGASLSGNKTLTISDAFTWTGGQISIDNEVSVGTAAISGPVSLDKCNLILAQGGVLNNATLIIKDEATLTVPLIKNLDFNYSSNIAINTIGPATIINNGTINKLGNGNLDLFPGFQNNGVLKINSGALNFQNSLTNNNTIKGIGVIGLSNANIFKMGKIAPGNSPGTINVTGNYPNQKLIIEITQNNGVEIDKLIATGQLQLKDTLIIEHLGGSIPNGSYEFMTCPLGTNCRKNTFEIISYPAFCGGGCSLEYNESNVKLVYEQGLPIELASFTGRLINKEIELDWTTLSEQNAASFDIMRSANGNEWVYLGEVSANGTTSAQHDYSFIDTDPLSGENYYRLKQHDLDGTIYYSKVIRIQTPIKKAWKLYPNPVQDVLEVRFSNNEDGILQIFDATGRLVLKQNIEAKQSINLDLSPLASGLYWVQMTGFKTEMVVKH